MTRKILLAVLFTTALVTNFSFTSPVPSKAESTADDKKITVVVCLDQNGCRYCGGAQLTPTSTTLCAGSSCNGVTQIICVTFYTRTNPGTGKEEVDDSNLSISYSDPAMKGGIDETALKADFIAQVNAQL